MRRMIPDSLARWARALKDHLLQNGNKTEVGGDLEVDGVVYADKIKDRVGDAEGVHTTIDLGTEDVSTNANVNIGESENPKDLYVSGDIDFDGEITKGGQPLGGGTQLYKHIIQQAQVGVDGQIVIFSTNNTPITYSNADNLEGFMVGGYYNLGGGTNNIPVIALERSGPSAYSAYYVQGGEIKSVSVNASTPDEVSKL